MPIYSSPLYHMHLKFCGSLDSGRWQSISDIIKLWTIYPPKPNENTYACCIPYLWKYITTLNNNKLDPRHPSNTWLTYVPPREVELSRWVEMSKSLCGYFFSTFPNCLWSLTIPSFSWKGSFKSAFASVPVSRWVYCSSQDGTESYIHCNGRNKRLPPPLPPPQPPLLFIV